MNAYDYYASNDIHKHILALFSCARKWLIKAKKKIFIQINISHLKLVLLLVYQIDYDYADALQVYFSGCSFVMKSHRFPALEPLTGYECKEYLASNDIHKTLHVYFNCPRKFRGKNRNMKIF
ncbi:unnamed protein product [Rotaria magnacalcarata]